MTFAVIAGAQNVHPAADKARFARIGNGSDGFGRSRTASCGSSVETGATLGDDLDFVRRLHGSDGVTGVDRALEGVRRIDLGDFGDLGDVQLGSDARQDVLAVSGCWRQDVRVAGSDGQCLLGDVFRQAVGHMGGIGDDDLGDASHLGSCSCSGAAIAAGDQQMDLTAASDGCGYGVEGASLEGGVVVFSDNECDHDIFFLE